MTSYMNNKLEKKLKELREIFLEKESKYSQVYELENMLLKNNHVFFLLLKKYNIPHEIVNGEYMFDVEQ